MSHTTPTITCVALLVTTLAMTAVPARAGPTPDAVPAAAPSTLVMKPPPGMVEAMQRDLGITAAQARRRLANEARASAVEARLRERLGGAFAGTWVTGPTSSTVLVATTDPAKTDSIYAESAQPRVVVRALSALEAAKKALDAAVAPASTPVWYIDVRTNSVVVRSSDPAEARAFVAASGADKTVVRVVRSQERPRTLYDLRGGDAYYIDRAARCSVGFAVTRGSTNGFVSAGHCGVAGAGTTGFNRVAQGTFQASSFPGNDFSWVAVNSDWTPRPWVNNGGGGDVVVSGAASAVEGASVCRSGSTSGWHCGTVQQRGTSVAYAEGTVNEVTRTSVCAEPGDSGGPFISGAQAQGVTSGGSGNCTAGGTTYFQPVSEILSTYGLTLTTSGGTPPPNGCTGYQQTRAGSLISGQSAYQPDGTYYQSTAAGVHRACLDASDGTDFDLYLQKWNGTSWVTVASSTSPGPDEALTYSGTAGYYYYRIHAYSGTGIYAFAFTKP
ncbi:alpha-lytic protease prodomain-containing protein [Microbispora sp. NPDC049125]|uniref:S1 family peptidase n=1 Tax=Microbispora sp. NPDC049125 TaxID=3154929 RepID=UPI003464FF75